MKRRIFRRLFILYALVLLLSIFFIDFYITRIVRNHYIDGLKDNLSIQAGLMAENIIFDPAADLDNYCKRIKEKTGARVTVIDSGGRVLGDSDRLSASMENHMDRPEIQESIIAGTGWTIRHSDSVRYDLFYLAQKIMKDDTLQGFIRLAVPLGEVDKSINVLRLKINTVVIIFFLSAGILLIWHTERIRGFVLQVIDFSRSLAKGSLGSRLFLKHAGEFSELAQNLDDMAEELKINLDKREEEKNRLDVILKNIPDALLLINTNGVIEQANRAATELFGGSDLMGRPLIQVVRNPDFITLIDEVRQSLSPGFSELAFDYPEEKYLTAKVSPLFYKERKLSGFVAVFHDITQMKKLEQMRKDFMANVSHEIKTPVTAIKGFAETLLDGAIFDKDNALKFLNTIKNQSERLNRIVEDLLTISKIELGVIRIDKTDVDISDVVDSAMNALVVQAAGKNIALRKSLEPDNMTIRADRDKLEQILLNLLDNAIKFTESGSITIGVSRDEGMQYVYVKDTGSGIPGKYLPRLGERFFRVDPSRSRELGGTGLGLAIVKHLVKAHGWEMKILSEEGRGTEVRVYILQ
ncbi:MAG: PAS domain S-box protein [Nitrospiraceae bacterium]|nr:MAG: PAS domain S-box protein [Nitrospiraceae bacterium]